MKVRKRWLAALCALVLMLGVVTVATGRTAGAAEAQPAAEIEVQNESGVQFDRISLEIGATSSQRNFNWMSTSDLDGYVQVALMPEGWTSGSVFPADADFVANVQAERGGSEREGWSSYKATVGGLEGNTSYIYRVGNGTNWSAAYGFETGNIGNGESFSFMFAGDPQIGASGNAASDTEGWTNTLDTMMSAFPETDFMISLGDQINASNPETVESEYEGYFAPEVLHGITMATNVGNHEAGANNQHYSYNYNMPNRSAWGAVDSTGAASGDYWFNYNGVLFMSINSNEQNTAVHKAFLEEAIAANPDANWKIVTFHHSVYSTASHTTDGDILARRSTLPVVFSDLDIDAVLMGHDHVYTRTYLMDGTTPVTEGGVQDVLTDPADGQVLYITANSASGSKYYNIKDNVEKSFSAVEDQSKRQNMSLATVTEDSITFTTYYTDDAQVTDADILDQVTIQRTPEPEAEPKVDRVSLQIGATETSRNFNWISDAGENGAVQVAVMPEGWQQGDAFPANPDYVANVKASVGGSEVEGYSSFKATVDGLDANTSYVYRVGTNGVWSEAYGFQTGNIGNGESFSFMFAGDPQIGAGDIPEDTEGWTNTLDTMEAAFPETDFLISLGDQVNLGHSGETQYEEYEGYYAPEVLHSITMAVNVGNHETYVSDQNYSHNYNMPNVSTYGVTDATGDGSGDYWFTYNGVLFMSINSNNMSTAEHKAFLEDAIAANPDANWKIVTFHHSVYSTASHTADTDILERRNELPAVFTELDIDAVLMGHDHVYTRTYLMDGTTPLITDEVQSEHVNPADGQVLYITANSASGSKYYSLQNLPQNTFAAVQDQSKRENMTLVDVTEDSLTFTTYFTDDAQVTEDDVLDKVSIVRSDDPVEPAQPEVERVSLEIGATETSRNFNWLGTTTKDAMVQVAEKPEGWTAGSDFPTEGVVSVTADVDGSELEGWNSFKATVDDLAANTDYLYRVGNEGAWSETYEFSTGNLGDGESFSFMFAGDPQIGASGDVASDVEGWTNTLDTMTAAFPDTDFMISLGDQVNTRDVNTIEEEYEGFFAPEALHGITLATNVGNHDTYNNNQHYTYNFTMPNVSELGATDNAGDGSGDFWFTYNGVLFMSLNSNNMSTSEHKAFMEDAIAQNPDANWKIVTFHHSVYSVASHTADSDILQRRSELPVVFSDLGVDAVLMGHDHVYTRTYLMEGTKPVITDEVQDTLTNPESGQVLYITANSASGSKYYEIQNLAQNTFSAVQDQSQRQNMSIATVTDDSITFTTYYTDDAQVTEDDILDQVTIERVDDQQGGQQPGGDDQQPGDSQQPGDNNNQQGGSGNGGQTTSDPQQGSQSQAGSQGSAGSGSLPGTGDASVTPAAIAALAAAGMTVVALRSAIITRRGSN